MSTNNQLSHAAQIAITSGLGLALALGPAMSCPMRAWAEEGAITITQQHNKNATYDAYMLFKADVSKDDQATHIAWASESMKKIVLAFLDGNGYKKWLESNHPGSDQHDLPQNAAEFISEMITGSKTAAGTSTKPRTTAAASFANKLAKALASNNASPRQVATAGTEFKGLEGYWLFVTTPSTTKDADDAGSAPMWVALGGSINKIVEKSAVPTADKEVREDSTQAWGKLADAHVGQSVEYRLLGSLPSNLATFEHYHFMFTDTLSAGLDLDIPAGKTAADAVAIMVGDKAVTADGTKVKVTYDNRKLVIDFADLLDSSWSEYHITSDTKITVTYRAHLNEACVVGTPGNPNEITLTYTNDPITQREGASTPGKPTPKTYTYKMTLKKYDEQTGERLPGAQFTMKVADDNKDKESRGLYVQANGSLAKDAHAFVTDKDGSFMVSGLDEGAYILSETKAPEGYEPIDSDLILTIVADRDGTGQQITDLRADLKGGDAVDVGAVKKTAIAGLDADGGAVSIDVTNDRWIKMPVTGLGGNTAMVGMGGATAVAAGIALLLRRRR